MKLLPCTSLVAAPGTRCINVSVTFMEPLRSKADAPTVCTIAGTLSRSSPPLGGAGSLSVLGWLVVAAEVPPDPVRRPLPVVVWLVAGRGVGGTTSIPGSATEFD